MYYNGSSWVRNAHGGRKGAGVVVYTGGHVAFLTSPENSGTTATMSEGMRIDNNGNMGLGDTGPANFTGYTNLSIHGSSGGTITFGDDGTDEWEIYGGDGSVRIYDRTNTVERCRIDDNGSFRIGNTSQNQYTAADDLIVGNGSGNRGLTLYSGSSDAGVIAFSDGTSDTAYRSGQIIYDHNDNAMDFRTNGNNVRLKITNTGKVQVLGTQSNDPLYVRGGTESNASIRLEGGDNGADNSRIEAKFNLALACNGDGNQSSRSIRFYNNTTQLANIDSNAKLTVNGFIESTAGASSGRGAKLGNISVGYDNLYNTVQSLANSYTLHLQYNVNGDIQCNEGGGDMITADIKPRTNATFDLGTSTVGWRNIYTNDLHLNNLSKENGNDVDGTNGSWVIQEGKDDLYIINKINGKKYRIPLEEVD